MHTKHGHGEGSSPALHGDTLVINWDHEEQSFLVALDKRTGKQRWRVARAEDTSWATPIVVEHGGKAQVIVPGTQRLRGYDLASGELHLGMRRAVVQHRRVAGGGQRRGVSPAAATTRALDARRPPRRRQGRHHRHRPGRWTRRRGTPYVPSPLLYGESLYNLQHYQGVLVRIDPKTGEDQGEPLRLPMIQSVYASPVGAAGRIYVTSREGVTQVLSHGEKEPRTLAVNRLDDNFSASAALVGRDLLLRGERALYCIGED